MKWKVLFFLFVVSSLAFATGFDGFEWGTAPDTVKAKYMSWEFVDNYDEEFNEYVIFIDDVVLNQEARKTFAFFNNELYMGCLCFDLSYSKQDNAYSFFYDVKELIEAKYGEPFHNDLGLGVGYKEQAYADLSEKDKNVRVFTGDISPGAAWAIGNAWDKTDPKATLINLFITVEGFLSEASINVVYTNPLRFESRNRQRKEVQKEYF